MSDTAPRGYFKIARKAFDQKHGDALWLEERQFSRYEAWLDLLQMTAHADRTVETKYGAVALRRGEILTAIRFLANRWGWGKERVQQFLAWCVEDGRLAPAVIVPDAKADAKPDAKPDAKRGRQGTVYVVVNYDRYQSTAPAAERENRTQKRTQSQTQKRDKEEEVTTIPVGLAAPMAGNWTAEYGREWEAAKPGSRAPYGRIGKALKALVDRDGPDLHRQAWQVFCASADSRFGPEHFPANVDRYAPKPVRRAMTSAGLPAMDRDEYEAYEREQMEAVNRARVARGEAPLPFEVRRAA